MTSLLLCFDFRVLLKSVWRHFTYVSQLRKALYLFDVLEDIQVRFFEENKMEGVRWEAYGSFGPQDVHRQVRVTHF